MIFDFNNWPGTVAFGGDFSPDILPVHQYISYVQYSEYTPGGGEAGSDFSFAWRESFDDATFPAGWGRGSWDSPLGQSTHVPANVNIVDGVLVLSLTADDETGFSGSPPADPQDLPNARAGESGTGGAAVSTGGADSGDALGATGGSPGMGGAGDGMGASSSRDETGCSCRSGAGLPRSRSSAGAFLAVVLGLIAWTVRRRRWSN
jgi:hypothetical protein